VVPFPAIAGQERSPSRENPPYFQAFPALHWYFVQCSNYMSYPTLVFGTKERHHMWNGRGISLDLVAQRQRWEKLTKAIVLPRSAIWPDDAADTELREIQNFGSNPGALRMFTFAPPDLPAGSPLVVVLHGCGQTAAGYDMGAGWSTLAKRYGFALLLPQQQKSNNPNGCFNWFLTGDIERGHGEPLSIRQMIEQMVSEHGVDRRRVFITGLSAGGAMTSVMLATYPDVFAGGAIIAGLPYDAATNIQQAFARMTQCPPRTARAWGDLVRSASPSDLASPTLAAAKVWPRLSVWHGGADTIVVPSNANEIVKQWTNVHALDIEPSFTEVVDGFPRQVWRGADGQDLIESFTIPSMAHGAPLAVGEDCDQCGRAGAFLLDVGISSSYHIAKFWGLTGDAASRKTGKAVAAGRKRKAAAEMPREQAFAPKPEQAHASQAHGSHSRGVSHFDIGAVITNALKAAGLMKPPGG
jgi:poly(hydroxyalkanoate) depolymerase family esterase